MGFGNDQAPSPAPASGKKYTLEVLQRILLQSIALTNSIVRTEHQVPGYREAVLALPDRRLLRGLPMEVRSFLERELDALEPGCECHPQFGASACPKHGMEGA